MAGQVKKYRAKGHKQRGKTKFVKQGVQRGSLRTLSIAKARSVAAHLEADRQVIHAVKVEGLTQVEVAQALGVSQPTVHRLVKRWGDKTPQLIELAADPYVVAQLYAAGKIDRAAMVKALSEYEYAPEDLDDVAIADLPGPGEPTTFSNTVGRAYDDQLISAADYDQIATLSV